MCGKLAMAYDRTENVIYLVLTERIARSWARVRNRESNVFKRGYPTKTHKLSLTMVDASNMGSNFQHFFKSFVGCEYWVREFAGIEILTSPVKSPSITCHTTISCEIDYDRIWESFNKSLSITTMCGQMFSSIAVIELVKIIDKLFEQSNSLWLINWCQRAKTLRF